MGLSFALNFVGGGSTAIVKDGVTLSGGSDITISAIGADLSVTKAVAGTAAGSVGISPSVALLLAHDSTLARLGTGPDTSNTGALTISAQHKATADTTADASVSAAGKVAVGAAVALNIMLDAADAISFRNIAAGKTVTVSADLASSGNATAIASTKGATPQGSGEPTTANGQVSGLTAFGNNQAGTSATAPQVAKTSNGTGSEQTVGVAAALALNVMSGHARATLPKTITVSSSGGGVAVLSALDVDANAQADGSADQAKTGIGVGVAINVVSVDNTALLAAPTTANGAVTVSATMSPQGDGTDTFVAIAHSGAGGRSVGVAGSVALDLITVGTSAQITAPVDAGGGGVAVIAAAKSDTTTTATSSATASGGGDRSGVGVGASFALSLLNLDVTAQVPDTIAITSAGATTVQATGAHAARTLAQAGSAGNVSVSPAVALTIATSNTTAYLGTGPTLNASGSVLVDANHSGDYSTKADASSGGQDVAVGAAIAIGIVLESGTATVARNIAAGGDVRVRGRSAIGGAVEADGGASGNSSNGNSADSESNNAVNSNSNIKGNPDVQAQPGGVVAVPKAKNSTDTANATTQQQSDGKGSGGVGVGAAIAVNVITTNATTTVQPNLSVTSGGTVAVSTTMQVDGSAKAFGTAIKDTSKDTAVGAGVAVNVVTAKNTATIGDGATVRAVTGLTISAGMAQRGAGDLTNDMVVQSAAAGGAKKNGIAGSVTVDVVNVQTTATLGKSTDVIVSTGGATVSTDARFTTQNLAGSGAFGSDVGVGAAVVVQITTITTTASIGDFSQVDAAGGLSVLASSSYVPKADNFKGLSVSLSSGAFGGGASDSGTAVGGSVNVNLINMSTQALIADSVHVNARNPGVGAVKLAATSAMTLFSGAGGIGAALGNTGIGIGIDVTIVNQKTLAQIGDKVTVATAGDVSTTATSRNQQTSVAGSFGAAKQTGGAGSIVVNLFNMGSDPLNGTRALLGTDSTINAGGKVSFVAGNPGPNSPDTLTLIAGSVALSLQNSVGIASIIAIRKDTFQAAVGDRSQITMVNGLDVIAQSGRSANLIAAAGAGGVKAGGAGSLIVSTFTESASATIGQDAVVTGNGPTADIHIVAQDTTTMTKVAGAVGFSGNTGIGAGLDVGVFSKTTTASIGARTVVDTGGSVEIRALNKESLTAFAASGGASGELAIAGSVDVAVYSITTRAFIEGTVSGARTSVAADGNVIVEANDENEMDMFAGGLAAAGSNAIGASVPVPIVNKTTEAFAGQNAIVIARGLRDASTVHSGGYTTTYVDPPKRGSSTPPEVSTTLTSGGGFTLVAKGGSGNGLPSGGGPVGDPNAGKVKQVTEGTVQMKGVAISATGYDDIGLVGISGGAAGSVAVNVTGVVNVSNIKTLAHVDAGAAINEPGVGGANQSVLVVAAEDYSKLTVAVGLAASGSVAVAPSVAVDVITLTTQALVAGTARIDAVDTVMIKARAAEDIKSVVASLAASGSVGVAGSPAIIVLSSTTLAQIGTIGTASDTPAIVNAGGSVVVQATDDTSTLAIAGSAGFAGSAGIGAGVGVTAISKDTDAQIAGGSTVNAGGATGVASVNTLGGLDSRFGATTSGLIVEAGSGENLQTYAIAGGVGGSVGVAGGVGITFVDSDTAATIGAGALVNAGGGANGTLQNIRVAASNAVTITSVAGGLGGGSVGVAGALGVGIVRNGTEASIGSNATVIAAGSVAVQAMSAQNIVAVAASAGLGGFAGAISFGIWVIGGDYNAGGGSASESAFTSTYQSTVSGAAFGGFQRSLDGYNGIAFAAADVDASGDTVNLHTTTLRTGDAIVYRANAGSSVPGLVNGQTYYVVTTATPGRYKLASSAAAADAGSGIDLGAASGTGSFLTGSSNRSQSGLQQARSGLAGGAPTTTLSSFLPASPTGATATQGTVALVKAGANIGAGTGMTVAAKDTLTFTQVSGQVAAGGTGIGGAFSTLIHTNPVIATIGDNATLGVGGTGLAISALSSEKITQVAAGFAGAGSAAITGSVTIALLTETTQAAIGNGVTITGSITVSGVNPDVTVTAKDDTTITDVAGALGVAGGAAVGVGVDVETVSKTTTATIGQSAAITTAGSVEVRSATTEAIVSVGVAIGAAGAAAVNAAASIVVVNLDTEALIAASPATNIVADGNVIVEAASHSEYDLWGGTLSAAGGASVGGAAAVPIISKTTKAEIGDGASVTGKGLRNATSVRTGGFLDVISSKNTDVTTGGAAGGDLGLGSPSYSDDGSGDDAKPRDSYDGDDNAPGDADAGKHKAVAGVNKAFRGVAVSATNSDDVASLGIAAGAAGVASVQLAGAVQVINVDTLARVGVGTKINQAGVNTPQDVLVTSGNDLHSLNVGASAAAAVAASIAPAASVQIINVTSRAIVDKNAVVTAGRSLVVNATGSERIISVSAALAVAGYAGVALAPNVLVLNSTTQATLGNTGAATAAAGGSVGVLANDTTKLIGVVGAIGGGVAGIGAGVNVALITKQTTATIGDGSDVVAYTLAGQGTGFAGIVQALGSSSQDYAVLLRAGPVAGVVVQATSREDTTTIAGAGGVGLVGIAGAVNILIDNSDTVARIGANTTVGSNGSVVVGAANTVDSFIFAGSLAVGFAGIGGAVNVGTIRNGVDASLGNNAQINSGASTEVIALSRKDIDALSIGAAAGAVAATGSIGVFTIGGNVNTNYNYDQRNADGSAGPSQGDDALGDGASGWNNEYDGYANGSSSPGGSNSTILNSHAGNGGSNSRVAAAAAAAKPKVAAAKPTTSITAQLAAGGDLQGTVAHVDGGVAIDAGGPVRISAQDATTVTTTVGSFSGGAISLGAPVTIVNLNMPVRAIVAAGALVISSSSVQVTAFQSTTVKGFAFAGQGGLGALGAQVVVINDNTQQTAEVHAGATINAATDIAIKATAQLADKARAFGATFSGVGVGVSLASVNIGGLTQAYNDGTATAGNNLSVTTQDSVVADTKSFGVGVAAAANLNGAVALSNVTETTEARTGASSSSSAGGSITVSGAASMRATAESDAISVALGAGLGVSVAIATLKPTMSASAGGSLKQGSGLTVTALFNASAYGAKTAGFNAQANAFTVGAALGAGAAGAIALSNTSPIITAQISNNASVLAQIGSAGPILVQAYASDEAQAQAKGFAFGLGAGLGASITSATLSGSTTARIGNGADIGTVNTGVGDVTVQAQTTNVANAQTFAVSGGLLAGVSVNSANASINTAIAGRVDAGVALYALTLKVTATEDTGTATSDAQGISIAGVGAVGFSQATSTHATQTRASVGGGGARTLINLAGNLIINATAINAKTTARSDASGGALLGSVQVNKATAQSTGSTTARIDNTSVIGTTKTDIQMNATSSAIVNATGSGRSISLIAGIGDVSSNATITEATLAAVGAGVNFGTRLNNGDGFTTTYVGGVHINATSSGSGTTNAEGASGGLVSSPSVSATLSVKPSAFATVGTDVLMAVAGDVVIGSNNRAEGDAALSGNSYGLIAIGSTTITHNVSQTAQTLIGGGTQIYANNITLTSNGGADPSAPRNYTVTADGVVASSDQLVINNHGLQTGDVVQLGTAGSTFGGLQTGRILPIIAVNSNTVRFGLVVDGSAVDAARDTITFAGPHFLQTGDKVFYGPQGGAVHPYWVNAISDTVIKLLDYDPTTAAGAARLAGTGFTGTAVNAANDTITINGNGLADGTRVTYRAPVTQFSFGVGDVDVEITGTRPNGKPQLSANAGSNDIYLPGHTFKNGDLVKYTVTGGSALTGLTNNTIYKVVRLDANFIQLVPQAGGAVIAIASNPNQLGATHTLTEVGTGPVAGLIDGTVYKIKVIDANTFKLTDLNGNVINIGAAGVGTHRLTTDGIDLQPTTGQQQIYLNLAVGGTTTLLGVGGVALDTIIADPGDGVSRVTANGLSVGLGASTANLAVAHVTSTVRTIVSGGSVEDPTVLAPSYQTNSGSITVTSHGEAFASAVAGGDAGGLFAFPNADAEAIITGTSEALIGEADTNRGAGSTQVQTYNAPLTISATAQYGGEASSGGVGGGLIAVGGSNARALTTYLTRAGFGKASTPMSTPSTSRRIPATMNRSISATRRVDLAPARRRAAATPAALRRATTPS